MSNRPLDPLYADRTVDHIKNIWGKEVFLFEKDTNKKDKKDKDKKEE